MIKRWKIKNHEGMDLKTGQIFIKKDEMYLHILNILYEEIKELKKELKGDVK